MVRAVRRHTERAREATDAGREDGSIPPHVADALDNLSIALDLIADLLSAPPPTDSMG